MYDVCVEAGLLEAPLHTGLERRTPLLNLPGFSKKQVGRRFTWCHFLFYGGHRPMPEIARQVALTKIYSNPRLLGYYRTLSKRPTR